MNIEFIFSNLAVMGHSILILGGCSTDEINTVSFVDSERAIHSTSSKESATEFIYLNCCFYHGAHIMKSKADRKQTLASKNKNKYHEVFRQFPLQ